MVKNNNKPTVSIITVSQLKRFNCLEILNDLIKQQTYDNIIEWVIVEGSKNKDDGECNKANIKLLQTNIPIVYVDWQENVKLGELRNKGNNMCKGDITVCMDDDDYYPKSRVEHAVNKLKNSKANIAGCSALLIYDYFLEKIYKFNQFGPNHSTNNCMAWKKEYLLTNKHDNDKDMAEESSFTKNFSEPMVQLDADDTIVVSSHDSNTFNKRELLVGGTNKFNPTLMELPTSVIKHIPEVYLNKYKNIFVKEYTSKYDIVYFAGGFSIKWDPKDQSLGGSEQAIVNLVNNWTKLGKKVAVYGEVPEGTVNGVDYFNWKKFPFEATHNIVILWRGYGLWCGAPFPIKAKYVWLDLHDNFQESFINVWKKYQNKITKIFFKSEFHKEEFERASESKLEKLKYTIIPNGVRVDEFSRNKENAVRNPFRFCYCSCYTRGLGPILELVWPVIYHFEPRAELHVYYGMEHIKDPNLKEKMLKLLSQPGVMDHGRQPMDMIIREKYLSSFQLYVTNTPIEIDCISIRESLATGCIPLISNSGVFKDREGIHFQLEDQNRNCYQNLGVKIAELMKHPNELNNYRQQIKKSPLLTTWKQTAEAWLSNA
jgi:glycosyltransferase involved in cell wall biosynthesis